VETFARNPRQEHVMEAASQRRTLIVANRTAATPLLLEEVERRARERPTQFSLLIPNVPVRNHADWPMDRALALLERAAHGPVEGIMRANDDPFESVRQVLDEQQFDDVLISTLSRRTSEWLRRDLPSRVQKLGVPVAVVSQPAESVPTGVTAVGPSGF
jgi:hypothetical protein